MIGRIIWSLFWCAVFVPVVYAGSHAADAPGAAFALLCGVVVIVLLVVCRRANEPVR